MFEVGAETDQLPEFNCINWLRNTNQMRSLGLHLPSRAICLALGVGGFVATAFVIKKMICLCKEAIIIAKQIKQNTKSYKKDLLLRKKRHAIIQKAVNMGIGGVVLLIMTGFFVVINAALLKDLRNRYVEDKKSYDDTVFLDRHRELNDFEPQRILADPRVLSQGMTIPDGIIGFSVVGSTAAPHRLERDFAQHGLFKRSGQLRPLGGNDAIFCTRIFNDDLGFMAAALGTSIFRCPRVGHRTFLLGALNKRIAFSDERLEQFGFQPPLGDDEHAGDTHDVFID